MKLNRIGSNWTELERNKINENWRIIEGNYNDVVGQITDEVVDHLIDSAKLNWKEPVDKYADLPSGAGEGDTRMVRDSGKVYRFNGKVWQEIQQIDAGPVNELDARLTTQLADMTSFNNYEIQNKTRKTEALFTIIDDDGSKDILNLLRPLQQEFNIPMTTAVITDWIGNTGAIPRLTKEDLLQLVEEGWEVSSHTHTHARLDELTPEEQYVEMKKSVDKLKSWGIDCTTICYPFSSRNDDTIIEARKLFRSGRSTDYGINRPPFQTWDIMAINGEGKEHTLESLKADIDDISENGGWGVYITHAGIAGDRATQMLREVIEYVLSKGNIEVVTYNEALNRMGNIIDNGRYLERDRSKPHFVVGADGSSSSNTNPALLSVHRRRSVDASIKPQEFEGGKIHVAETEAANNFIDWGIVVTNTLLEGNYFQEIYTHTGYKYIRQQVGDDWGEYFRHADNIYTSFNGVSSDSPITDFLKDKISYTKISGTNRTGFPYEKTGLLITNRTLSVDQGSYQLYFNTEATRNDIYRRYWVNGQWSNWERLNPTFAATNTYLRDRLREEYVSPGEMFFNTTLNKPIWRNATNDGWVDAVGNVVTL